MANNFIQSAARCVGHALYFHLIKLVKKGIIYYLAIKSTVFNTLFEIKRNFARIKKVFLL